MACSLDLLMVVWIRNYLNKMEYVFSSYRVPFSPWWYNLMLVSKANNSIFLAVELNGSLSFRHCSVIWKRTRGLIIFNAFLSFGSTEREQWNLRPLNFTQFPLIEWLLDKIRRLGFCKFCMIMVSDIPSDGAFSREVWQSVGAGLG